MRDHRCTYLMPLCGGMLLGLGLALPLVFYGYAQGASGMIQGLATGVAPLAV